MLKQKKQEVPSAQNRLSKVPEQNLFDVAVNVHLSLLHRILSVEVPRGKLKMCPHAVYTKRLRDFEPF